MNVKSAKDRTSRMSHEEKEPLEEDYLSSHSDDESESGSLSDAYFMRSDLGSQTFSSQSLTYSPPTSPAGKNLTTGDIGWLHASECDPLHAPMLNRHFDSNHLAYGSSDFSQAPPIYEDAVLLEEVKVSEPAGYNPKRQRFLNSKERRQFRQLRRKQLEQVERERTVQKIRGTMQESNTCRDSIFAALFVIQLVLVFFCAIRYGSEVILSCQSWSLFSRAAEEDGSRVLAAANDDESLATFVSDTVEGSVTEISQAATSFVLDYRSVMSIVGITGFYASILSLLSVGFMLIMVKSLIQTVLVFCILLSLAWGIIGYEVAPQHSIVAIMGLVALVYMVGYTVVVWDRIPFSATNLRTALAAMQSTADITLLGMTMILVAFSWCLVWCMAFIGLVDSLDVCEPGDKACRFNVTHHNNICLYILFLFSFCWTNQVIKNIVRATVASAVGTWWFHPEEISPCCSKAVRSALWRSTTTSLGSICFGSLVVPPCQFMMQVSRFFCTPKSRFTGTPNQQGCCGILTRWLLLCNRWSFSYIGMYGYNFVHAGEKAIQLFETREWMDVVNDNLIHNVLFMASVVLGGSTGVFGVFMEEVDGYTFTSFHKPVITAFIIGSVLGYVLSNILLVGVVGSAVNTILVCFAAGPFEFHKNHGRLSQEMRDVWSQQVWEPPV